MTMLFGDLVASNGAILFGDLSQAPSPAGAVLNDLGDDVELTAQAATLSGSGTLQASLVLNDLGDAVELFAQSGTLGGTGGISRPPTIIGSGALVGRAGMVAGTGTRTTGTTTKIMSGTGALVAGRAILWTPQPSTGGDAASRAVVRNVIRSLVRPVVRPTV